VPLQNSKGSFVCGSVKYIGWENYLLLFVSEMEQDRPLVTMEVVGSRLMLVSSSDLERWDIWDLKFLADLHNYARML